MSQDQLAGYDPAAEGSPLEQDRARTLSRPRPVYKKEQGIGGSDSKQDIDGRFKTYTWDKTFSYGQIDTSRFRSVFLADNSDFQTCVFLIEEYNKELKNFKDPSVSTDKKGEFKHGPWKMRFYSTLGNELKEVMNTRDRIAQKIFAKDVHDWAMKQIDALEADSKELKIFDNDVTFLSSSFKAPLRDFTKYKIVGGGSSSAVKERFDRTDEKHRRNLSYSFMNIRPISKDQSYMDNSNVIILNKTATGTVGGAGSSIPANDTTSPAVTFKILDESTKDATGLMETSNINNDYQGDMDNKSSSTLDNSGVMQLINTRPRMKQPSEIAAEELSDYEKLARTKHPEYEPPALRLRDFKRRVLSFDQPSKFEFKKNNEEEKNEFAGISYPKPISFKEMKRRKEEEERIARQQELEEEEREKREEMAAAGIVPDPNATGGISGTIEPVAGTNAGAEGEASGLNNTNNNLNNNQNEDGDDELGGLNEKVEGEDGEEKVEKPPLQPNIKNYIDDVVSKEKFVRDLNQKFDQRSDYAQYEPSKDEREVRMEQKWLEGRQRELKEKRENEEMIKMVSDYSLAKGRIEREINRKIDSSIFGSKFKLCEYRAQKKTAEELKSFDIKTKDFARKQNALQDLLDIEEKAKSIEFKKAERIERRKEREVRVAKALKKAKQASSKGSRFNDDDSGEEEARKDGRGTQSGEESFDEDLDGPFTLENPIVKSRPILQQLFLKKQKPQTKNCDMSSSLPAINAKVPQKGRSISNPFRGLEGDSRRQKILDIAKVHGNLIGININSAAAENGASAEGSIFSAVPMTSTIEYSDRKKNYSMHQASTNQEPSLSIYSRDVLQKLRPFSAIFDTYDIQTIQNDQIAEVLDVKNRMAKYKIALPYKKLKDAILIPEGFTDEADLEIIPEPGQGLFANPFMKEKKKKKKKKRS